MEICFTTMVPDHMEPKAEQVAYSKEEVFITKNAPYKENSQYLPTCQSQYLKFICLNNLCNLPSVSLYKKPSILLEIIAWF